MLILLLVQFILYRACSNVCVCIFQGGAKATIENLQQALSEAEGRNKEINREFKKLLREKEVCFCLLLCFDCGI